MESLDSELETKECSHCHIKLSLDQFSINKRNRDGLDYKCKTCAKEKYKEKAIAKGVYGKPYKKQAEPHKLIDGEECKKCYCCQKYKPLSNFNSNRTKWDKLHGDCKECTTKQMKKYNKTHREERKELYKKNKDHINLRDRTRYKNNEEYRKKKKERSIMYAKNNRERINARNRERRKNDPIFATQMSLRTLFIRHVMAKGKLKKLGNI